MTTRGLVCLELARELGIEGCKSCKTPIKEGELKQAPYGKWSKRRHGAVAWPVVRRVRDAIVAWCESERVAIHIPGQDTIGGEGITISAADGSSYARMLSVDGLADFVFSPECCMGENCQSRRWAARRQIKPVDEPEIAEAIAAIWTMRKSYDGVCISGGQVTPSSTEKFLQRVSADIGKGGRIDKEVVREAQKRITTK